MSPGGETWSLAPQFGDLMSVEGGYTTTLGKFAASWKLNGKTGYTLSYNVPVGTKGTWVLPALNEKVPSITLDGNAFTNGVFDSAAGLVTVPNQSGGKHTVTVVY